MKLTLHKLNILIVTIFVILFSSGSLYLFMKEKKNLSCEIINSLKGVVFDIGYIVSNKLSNRETYDIRPYLDRKVAAYPTIKSLSISDNKSIAISTNRSLVLKKIDKKVLSIKELKDCTNTRDGVYYSYQIDFYEQEKDIKKSLYLLIEIDTKKIDFHIQNNLESLIVFILFPSLLFIVLWFIFKILITKPLEELTLFSKDRNLNLRKYPLENIELLKVSLENSFNQLEDLNKNLQLRVEEEVKKRREKEYLLMQQSKDLALSELLINISHHWRQPLTAILSMIEDIEDAYEFNEIDKNYIQNFKNESSEILINLSNTISNFSLMYKTDKKEKNFFLKDAIEVALSLIYEYFNSLSIKIYKELDNSIEIRAIKSEWVQVILNILNNSKDIFLERKISNPTIKIKLYKEKSSIIVEIEDNGGGVKDELKSKIFEPYFTTKHKLMGAGLGLFTVKSIIERHSHGKIELKNLPNGAKFIIKV